MEKLDCCVQGQGHSKKEDWFAVFKVKVTVTNNIIKICRLNVLFELLICGLSCDMIGLLCCGQGQGHRKGSEFQ